MENKVSNKIEPFYPIYSRKPNTFLRYAEEQFDDGLGHTGIVRTAFFLDKNKKEQSMTAQVIWDKI